MLKNSWCTFFGQELPSECKLLGAVCTELLYSKLNLAVGGPGSKTQFNLTILLSHLSVQNMTTIKTLGMQENEAASPTSTLVAVKYVTLCISVSMSFFLSTFFYIFCDVGIFQLSVNLVSGWEYTGNMVQKIAMFGAIQYNVMNCPTI